MNAKISPFNALSLAAAAIYALLNAQPSTSSLHAAPLGTAFSYQGKLSSGTNAANGIYDFSFALYDAAAGGAQQGATQTTNAVTVTNGYFNVALDFGNTFDGNARWLAISVKTNGAGSYTLLVPRQPLTPAPYAFFASAAGTAGISSLATAVSPGAVNTSSLQDGAVTSAKIGGGNVVKTLNLLKDDITLAAGANLSLTPSGQTLTFASPTDWHVGGNAGTTVSVNFLGTLDPQPLELRVNNQRALVLDTNGNLSAGSTSTIQLAGGTWGATIGGGFANMIQAGGILSTIAAGQQNTIQAGGWTCTIGGGGVNTIQSNGYFATIPGGYYNAAAGKYSFAAGNHANATNDGTFVWADSQTGGFGSTGTNQFLIRAAGGVGIGTASPHKALDVFDGTGTNGTGGNVHIGGYYPNGDAKLIHFGDLQPTNGLGFVYLGENGQDDRLEFRADRFYFNNGSVGIGTTNPATALDVAGTVTATAFSGPGGGLTGIGTLSLGDNSVTAAKLASDVNSLAKVTAGNMTTAGSTVSLAVNEVLNDHDLYLRGDTYHGLGWYGSTKAFATGSMPDGPVLYGCQGGVLATTCTTPHATLTWDNSSVEVFGNFFVTNSLFADYSSQNNGALSPGLMFGGLGSGEGMASKRTATGNQYGLDFYTGYANRMSITQNGKVGIGTNSPSVRLEVVGTDSVTTTTDGFFDVGPANSWHITMGTQDIQVKNTPTAWDTLYLNWYGGNVSIASTNLYVSAGAGVSVNTRYNYGYRFYVNGTTFSTGGWGSSDARWKKNIQPVTGALDKVMRMQGVNFEWRRDEFPQLEFGEGIQLGFVAQEVEKVLPEAVHTDTEGYKAIAYEKLTAVLNEAIKEQQSEIKGQKSELDALKGRNAALEKDVAELKALVRNLAAHVKGGGQ